MRTPQRARSHSTLHGAPWLGPGAGCPVLWAISVRVQGDTPLLQVLGGRRREAGCGVDRRGEGGGGQQASHSVGAALLLGELDGVEEHVCDRGQAVLVHLWVIGDVGDECRDGADLGAEQREAVRAVSSVELLDVGLAQVDP